MATAIVELSKIDSLFSGVTKGSYPFPDSVPTKSYLFVDYKSGQEASDTSEGIAVVGQYGMKVKRVIMQPREPEILALIAVPIGEKVKWVDEFRKHASIEFAEPQYLMHSD